MRLLVVALIAVAVLAVACGGGDGAGSPSPTAALEYTFTCNTAAARGLAFAQGEATNVSGERLAGVSVEANWFSGSDAFITVDVAPIDMDVLLPGQTSAFAVGSEYNPAMKGCSLRFKGSSGPVIPSRRLPQ